MFYSPRITKSEMEQLQKLTSCSDEAALGKAEVVLMASDGIDSGAIARLLGTSERTVGHAVKRFNDGAPCGNRNAVKHGAYVSSGPSTEERALIADIKARFLRDFAGSDKDDTQLMRGQETATRHSLATGN